MYFLETMPGRCVDHESGSALLIVLAFVVILAVVLTAFLSSSSQALRQSESSATILQTQLLSQVATAAIIQDINDEMRAGAEGSPDTGEIMEVIQPWAMIPGRVVKDESILSDPRFANLVKQSVSGKEFFPGDNTRATYSAEGRQRAASHSTTTPSRNQRIISAARWDKPRLLGGASGLVNFTDNQAPDWIYITRSGASENGVISGAAGDKSPANEDYVLGRYAYNIYQVDGLLDINVAGFDPTDGGMVADATGKGSQAWADLRAIPGLENNGDAKAIVDWRNKESNTAYSKMVAGLTTSSPVGAAPNRWGEPGGFREPYRDAGRSDNRFFSRQDLLNFFQHQFGGASDQALPFLTTFSADLNQPSFRPEPNRPKVERNASAGGNDAHGNELLAVESQINPPFLKVVSGDEAVVKRRFPLDRLKYVVPEPQPEIAQKIEEYFGLTWDGNGWVYSLGAPITRLNALGGREPNMMELLKAAIATGSLGGQLNYGEVRAALLQARDSSIDYQVMRIAACIIDQYDSDSYPTRIRFGDYDIYGVEDLPYLYGLRVGAYRQESLVIADAVRPSANPTAYPIPTPSEAVNSGLYRSVVMIQPIIWNPHAPASSSAAPTQFRVTADTKGAVDVQPGARQRWWAAGSNYYYDWPSKTGDPRDESEPRAFNPSQDYVVFNVSQDSEAPASFREPYTLKALDFPVGSGAKAYDGINGGEFVETTLGASEQNDVAAGENSLQTIGFRAGWVWSGPWISGATSSNPTYLQEGKVFTNGIDFALQYRAANGAWVTYDVYEGFTNGNENFRLDRLNSGVVNPKPMRYYLRMDPRVDRYGSRVPLHYPYARSAVEGIPQGYSLRPSSAAGVHAGTGWPADGSNFNFVIPATSTDRSLGLLSENKSSSILRYEDPDGVLRLAMGGYANGTSGLPMARASGDFSSRPVVLNRPFRSVAELSYVLRDQPWKQLDFFSPQSGDAALLDVFCLYEQKDPSEEPVSAGKINLNSPHPEVIEAALRGVNVRDGVALDAPTVKVLAEKLVEWTKNGDSGKGPLRNRSELVGRFVSGTTYSGFSSTLDSTLSSLDAAFPLRRQNVFRGLVDLGTTRSWTFLIDLIVQDGQFIRSGTEAADFNVRGEKRLWVHVSIDRFTGKVISEQVEDVHE